MQRWLAPGSVILWWGGLVSYIRVTQGTGSGTSLGDLAATLPFLVIGFFGTLYCTVRNVNLNRPTKAILLTSAGALTVSSISFTECSSFFVLLSGAFTLFAAFYFLRAGTLGGDEG